MVLCVKTPLKNAQDVKRFLIEKRLFDPSYSFRKKDDFIFFPIKTKRGVKKEFSFVEFDEIRLPRSKKKGSFRTEVIGKLTKQELSHLRRAFDVTGSIAILEIPPELEKKELLLADTLLKLHRNIGTVLKKAGIHETEYRTQLMEHLAGKKTKETVHKEHGLRIKVDVEKVYFSPRLSTERKRIAQQVKKGESILVMFSGCAPYPCVLSKRTEAADIVGVEINPFGHKYGKQNLKLNKVKNANLFEGDVRDIVPGFKTKFDRIIMPLPKSAEDFLDVALGAAKKGTIIHLYAFKDKDSFDEAKANIKKACERNKMKCRILKTVRCGQHAPRVYRICIDFKVL